MPAKILVLGIDVNASLDEKFRNQVLEKLVKCQSDLAAYVEEKTKSLTEQELSFQEQRTLSHSLNLFEQFKLTLDLIQFSSFSSESNGQQDDKIEMSESAKQQQEKLNTELNACLKGTILVTFIFFFKYYFGTIFNNKDIIEYKMELNKFSKN